MLQTQLRSVQTIFGAWGMSPLSVPLYLHPGASNASGSVQPFNSSIFRHVRWRSKLRVWESRGEGTARQKVLEELAWCRYAPLWLLRVLLSAVVSRAVSLNISMHTRHHKLFCGNSWFRSAFLSVVASVFAADGRELRSLPPPKTTSPNDQ